MYSCHFKKYNCVYSIHGIFVGGINLLSTGDDCNNVNIVIFDGFLEDVNLSKLLVTTQGMFP